MDAIRTLYRKLPSGARSAVRSLAPGELRRWIAHQRAEVYLISYPKCGRTWLRLMLGKAIAEHFSLPEDEDILLLRWQTRPHPRLPLVTVVHEDRPMLKAPEELHTSKEKFRGKRVIFLARDPRDVIVSSYFEMSKRGNLFGDNPYESRKGVFEGSLPDFIHRKAGGFDTILQYYNIWAQNRHVPAGFLLVRYEDLKQNPGLELRRVVDFLGLSDIPDAVLDRAVKFTSFENMRQMEAQGMFQSGVLKPADHADQDSYKTRKGRVGGFREYLSGDEIAFVNRKMQAELSKDYGYQP